MLPYHNGAISLNENTFYPVKAAALSHFEYANTHLRSF